MNEKKAKALRKQCRTGVNETWKGNYKAMKAAIRKVSLERAPSTSKTESGPVPGSRIKFDGFRESRGQQPKYHRIPWIEKPIRQVKDKLLDMGVTFSKIPGKLKRQLVTLGRKSGPEIQGRCRTMVMPGVK